MSRAERLRGVRCSSSTRTSGAGSASLPAAGHSTNVTASGPR